MTNLNVMRVVWPAFLAACLLELVVFAVVDPAALASSDRPLGLSAQGVYTLAFFAFWAISAAACALTMLLLKTAAEVNGCPFKPEERPQGCPHPAGKA